MEEDESKKAIEKAMMLLLYKDRTKKELEDKLYLAGFSEKAVEGAITYVSGFGYLNDLRYATSYMNYRTGMKSRREIEYKLQQKGVSKDDIAMAFEEYEGDGEAVRYLLKKKLAGRDKSSLEYKDKSKIIAFLARKGFRMSDILQAFDE